MQINSTLSNTWLKAAVLGCLWASSEIVLGSFLHNIRAPFTGTILTFIGIVLLVSVSRLWKDKGLVWRAGLVCALMKAISPSAVILGPMIAITSQAFLIEFSLRIFRRNLFAAILGGMLAMSWNLVQLSFTYIIIYGTGMIDIYVNLTKFAQRQLGVGEGDYWLPLLTLLAVYIFFGMAASIMGFYIGGRVLKQPLQMKSISVKQVEKIKSHKAANNFQHSVIWLFANFLFLAGTMALMNFAQPLYWISAGIIITTIWAFRYHGSLRRLAKPAFWIMFIIITVLSGILFTEFNSGTPDFTKGLTAGLQMNFRAAVMIIGFSALSTELGNKIIRDFFMKSRLRQLPLALEVAFDALPQVISNLPKLSDVFRRPVNVLFQLVTQADFWLEQISIKMIKRNNIILIEGSKGDGKTSLITEVNDLLKNKNIITAGILAPAVFIDNKHSGYDLTDAWTNRRMELSRTNGKDNMPLVGYYYFNEETIKEGKLILQPGNCKDADLIIIDEVGPWELENQGWAENLNLLIKTTSSPMLWAVRRGIAQQVIDKWSLVDTLVVDAKTIKAEQLVDIISRKISEMNENKTSYISNK